MKTRLKVTTIAAVAALALATLPSCKKDNKKDQPKALTCNLISATIKDGSPTSRTITFSYNSENKINQIREVDGSKTNTTVLTYNASSVNIITNDGSKNTRKKILTLNSAGRVVREEERDVLKDTIKTFTDYVYNSNGELSSFTRKSGKSPAVISTIANINGNVVSVASSGDITTIEYFTDKMSMPGDYLDLVQRIDIGNNFYIINKNLVKSFTTGTDIINYEYTFDANNNINSCKVLAGSTTTDVIMQHECK